MKPNASPTSTIDAALAGAAARLSAVSATPRLDAELLMAIALGVDRDALLLSRRDRPVPESFWDLLARREAHEPIAYITGHRAFWTLDLTVGPGVLIPRPDSETLIEAAIDHFGASGPVRILDLGTGSGALLLAALDQWPGATGLGIDASEEALKIAEANARRLGFASRAAFRGGDWAAGLDECFDLILCNPPYIEEAADLPPDVAGWEPARALFAGADGLDAYRRLAPAVKSHLTEQGVACLEIGAGQAAAVTALFAAEGMKVRSRKDLSGHTRCIIITA